MLRRFGAGSPQGARVDREQGSSQGMFTSVLGSVGFAGFRHSFSGLSLPFLSNLGVLLVLSLPVGLYRFSSIPYIFLRDLLVILRGPSFPFNKEVGFSFN
jgi:hypothetical protein